MRTGKKILLLLTIAVLTICVNLVTDWGLNLSSSLKGGRGDV